jgi:hypothetical protein
LDKDNLKKELSKQSIAYYRGIVESDETSTISNIAKSLNISRELAVDLWMLCNVIKLGKPKITYKLPD